MGKIGLCNDGYPGYVPALPLRSESNEIHSRNRTHVRTTKNQLFGTQKTWLNCLSIIFTKPAIPRAHPRPTDKKFQLPAGPKSEIQAGKGVYLTITYPHRWTATP